MHVDDEGKLLLRCAERDAKRASSVLMWELVISRNETKESHVSLETLLGEEIDLFGSWRLHPCRWTGAMWWVSPLQMVRAPLDSYEVQWGCDFRFQQPPQIADPLWSMLSSGAGRVQVAKGSFTMQSRIL